ncbi:MAG: dTDP-4-dehydrorhamnose 3,5-epimerase [Alphaproteobacteria bacterium MarineAlpha4_Bin2]|nr:MAG: dTDP-4-dehydrorhamnose 3,5-epimerase [Alphaproteobacteria bacterium MarineAlpha4_Bin2]
MTQVESMEGVHLLPPTEIVDERGSLAKLIDRGASTLEGYVPVWRQAFISRTRQRNTVRGLHYQFGEGVEGKMISPLKGRMLWVLVDLRCGSKTFGQWMSSVISPEMNKSLLVEPRFAHGCYSLTNDVELLILSDAEAAPEFSGGIFWNDKGLAIDWPADPKPPIISEAHSAYPDFSAFIRDRGAL